MYVKPPFDYSSSIPTLEFISSGLRVTVRAFSILSCLPTQSSAQQFSLILH